MNTTVNICLPYEFINLEAHNMSQDFLYISIFILFNTGMSFHALLSDRYLLLHGANTSGKIPCPQHVACNSLAVLVIILCIFTQS